MSILGFKYSHKPELQSTTHVYLTSPSKTLRQQKIIIINQLYQKTTLHCPNIFPWEEQERTNSMQQARSHAAYCVLE